MDKIESWFLNQFAGKLVARASILIAAYVAGPVVQGLAVKAGVQIAEQIVLALAGDQVPCAVNAQEGSVPRPR